jgi:Arc/MetJ-type ribon-helix-helix transcriptional regulator
MFIGMATVQIAVRLDESQLEVLDSLIAKGEFTSRADAVRSGVAAVIAAVESRRIDDAIRDGYEKHPPTSGEMDADRAALREAIAEEPW